MPTAAPITKALASRISSTIRASGTALPPCRKMQPYTR
jgi:hypothetical protein